MVVNIDFREGRKQIVGLNNGLVQVTSTKANGLEVWESTGWEEEMYS